MINTTTTDLHLSKSSNEFEDISDLESATVSGGFWGIAIPVAVALGTSIYLSIKHKGIVLGYDSKAADGAQKFVSQQTGSRRKFLGLF